MCGARPLMSGRMPCPAGAGREDNGGGEQDQGGEGPGLEGDEGVVDTVVDTVWNLFQHL